MPAQARLVTGPAWRALFVVEVVRLALPYEPMSSLARTTLVAAVIMISAMLLVAGGLARSRSSWHERCTYGSSDRAVLTCVHWNFARSALDRHGFSPYRSSARVYRSTMTVRSCLANVVTRDGRPGTRCSRWRLVRAGQKIVQEGWGVFAPSAMAKTYRRRANGRSVLTGSVAAPMGPHAKPS